MEIDFCPRWILAKLHIPGRSQHHVAILISTLAVLLVVPIIPHRWPASIAGRSQADYLRQLRVHLERLIAERPLVFRVENCR